jgi:hypothetical protein
MHDVMDRQFVSPFSRGHRLLVNLTAGEVCKPRGVEPKKVRSGLPVTVKWEWQDNPFTLKGAADREV